MDRVHRSQRVGVPQHALKLRDRGDLTVKHGRARRWFDPRVARLQQRRPGSRLPRDGHA